jgi:hypothetical protein
MAQAVAETVEHLRAAVKRRQEGAKPPEQIVWPLAVKGTLTREEIYGYLADQN